MTTQREPDTSAEGLRAWAARCDDAAATDELDPIKCSAFFADLGAFLRALADAAGQVAPLPAWVGEELNRRAGVESALRNAGKGAGLTADECRNLAVTLSVPKKYWAPSPAPVPSPVEGLEVSDDMRRYYAQGGSLPEAMLARDLIKVDARAEGLAKEVERLKAEAANAAKTFHGNQWRQLKEAEVREAKLREALDVLLDGAREAERVLKFAIEDGFLSEQKVSELCIDPYGVLRYLRFVIARAALASFSPTKEKKS